MSILAYTCFCFFFFSLFSSFEYFVYYFHDILLSEHTVSGPLSPTHRKKITKNSAFIGHNDDNAQSRSRFIDYCMFKVYCLVPAIPLRSINDHEMIDTVAYIA